MSGLELSPYNQPAAQNLQPVDRQAELEYRQQLVERFVQESVGSVGLHTSMDLNRDEQQRMFVVMTERNPDKEMRKPTGRGGWGDYGERDIGTRQVSDPFGEFTYLSGKNAERLGFMELPDGTVDVRYAFAWNGYADATGRPGNILHVGFVLPKKSAGRLWESTQKDPSFVRELVKGQLLAIGVPEAYWNRFLRPNYGIFEDPPKDPALHIVNLREDNSVLDQADIPLSLHGSMQPQVPEIFSSEPTEQDSEASYNAGYRKAEESARASIKAWGAMYEANIGLTPEGALDTLARIGIRNHVDAQNGIKSFENYGARDANCVVFEEHLSAQEKDKDHPNAFAISYFQTTVQRYVKEAAKKGLSTEETLNPAHVFDFTEDDFGEVGQTIVMISDHLRHNGFVVTDEYFAKSLEEARAKIQLQTH